MRLISTTEETWASKLNSYLNFSEILLARSFFQQQKILRRAAYAIQFLWSSKLCETPISIHLYHQFQVGLLESSATGKREKTWRRGKLLGLLYFMPSSISPVKTFFQTSGASG
jgi:hypothetical protein